MAKTWAEKMRAPAPHVETTDKPFAGIPPGSKLLISSPAEIQAYLRRAVRRGATLDIRTMRDRLAKKHGADAACPLSTSIFLRIVAEHAWEQLMQGVTIDDVAPFWRVVDPASPLAKKLRAGPEWIAKQRAAESMQTA